MPPLAAGPPSAAATAAGSALDGLQLRIENELDKISRELWEFDGSDDVLDNILRKLSLLKAQVKVQKTLQGTANMLRQHTSSQALPKQQATKVKHMIRFVFRKDSRGGGRHRLLRQLDCDTLKLCALSYTTDEIAKMEDSKFKLVYTNAAEFMHRRRLSPLLYRPDVDKAVDSRFKDPEDHKAFDEFLKTHAIRRVTARKRNYDTMASSNESPQSGERRASLPPVDKASTAPSNTLTPHHNIGSDEGEEGNAKPVMYGDVFSVNIADARYALESAENVSEIYLTQPWQADKFGRKHAFLTAWLSEDLGKILANAATAVNYMRAASQ